jgi:hypothetical protein
MVCPLAKWSWCFIQLSATRLCLQERSLFNMRKTDPGYDGLCDVKQVTTQTYRRYVFLFYFDFGIEFNSGNPNLRWTDSIVFTVGIRIRVIMLYDYNCVRFIYKFSPKLNQDQMTKRMDRMRPYVAWARAFFLWS